MQIKSIPSAYFFLIPLDFIATDYKKEYIFFIKGSH